MVDGFAGFVAGAACGVLRYPAVLCLVLACMGWDDLVMVVPEARWRAGDPLRGLEQLMLERAASGEVLDGVGAVPSLDEAVSTAGDQDRSVRAQVVRHLLTGTDWAVDPKGVRLRGLRISGLLDLEGATVRWPLWLEDCDLVDPRPFAIGLAAIPHLAVIRCRLAGLSGNTVAIAGNLELRGSEFAGSADLEGARIGGWLDCRESVFAGPIVLAAAQIGGSMVFSGARLGADQNGVSLTGHGMNLRLSAHLRDFTTTGSIYLARAEIGGDLICHNAHLGASSWGGSLTAPRARIRGGVFLDGEFRAQGAVQLAGASIGGLLQCDGARLGADVGGNSFVCDGIRTGGSVSLDAADGAAFTTDGAIRLSGAEVTGSLSCRGAQLGANQDGNSLVADEVKVSVGVLLDTGFAAIGAVRLPGADITGQLRCQGSQITGTDQDGNSLVGTGIKVGGPAYLDQGFLAAGAVEFTGADIGGMFTLDGARLGISNEGHALACDGLKAARDVLVRDTILEGAIRLYGAVIGGSLVCRGARLSTGSQQYALVALRLKTGGDVVFDKLISAGAVVVAGADIGRRLSCRKALIDGRDADGDALSAGGAKIGGSVLLSELRTTAGGVPAIACQYRPVTALRRRRAQRGHRPGRAGRSAGKRHRRRIARRGLLRSRQRLVARGIDPPRAAVGTWGARYWGNQPRGSPDTAAHRQLGRCAGPGLLARRTAAARRVHL